MTDTILHKHEDTAHTLRHRCGLPCTTNTQPGKVRPDPYQPTPSGPCSCSRGANQKGNTVMQLQQLLVLHSPLLPPPVLVLLLARLPLGRLHWVHRALCDVAPRLVHLLNIHIHLLHLLLAKGKGHSAAPHLGRTSLLLGGPAVAASGRRGERWEAAHVSV